METNIKLLGFSNQSFNGVPIDKRGFDLEYDGRYLDVNTFNNNNVYYTRLNNNDLMKLLNKPSSSMPLEERIANANYYSPQLEANGYITNEELDAIFTPAEMQKTITLSPINAMTIKKPYSSRKSHSLKSSTKRNNRRKKHVTIKSPKVSHIKSNKITKRLNSYKIKTTTTPKKSIKKTTHISVEPSPKSIQKTIY
jgi:hypothetical protein